MRGRVLAAVALVSLAALGWQGFALRPARAQTEGSGFAIEPDHIAFSVPDLEQSIAWYRRMLGFDVVRRGTANTNGKMKIAPLRRGDFNIELFEVEGARPMPAYRRDPSADLRVHGTKHIGFRSTTRAPRQRRSRRRAPTSRSVPSKTKDRSSSSSATTRVIRSS